MRLTTRLHDRDNAQLTYVYPVVSRRAQGVSIGINLNPNNACNWRCVYCQVPGLILGKGPDIDLPLLESELNQMLEAIVHGSFMDEHVPADSRRLNDVAFSGNGEPTSSPQFREAVEIVLNALKAFELTPAVKPIVITNGSLIRNAGVIDALQRLSEAEGQIWFKLDRATEAGLLELNSTKIDPHRQLQNLTLAARACPTWIQTCMLARHGEPPPESELNAYLTAIESLVAEQTPLLGVLLYGLERVSHQPEAPELSALPTEWFTKFAARIKATGLPVRAHP